MAQDPSPAPVAPDRSPPAPATGGWGVFVLLLVLAGGGGVAWYATRTGGDGSKGDGSKGDGAKGDGPKGAKGGEARPVPVVATAARRGDVNLYLTGLGSVTPFGTVTIRSRVEGELVRVSFVEGQLVHAGDAIAEIDSRAFTVQLAAARAQLERDASQLENARLNLERLRTARDAISDQQIDSQASLVAQLDAALKSDQAAVDNANLQLTYCKITSPLTGRIGLRTVDAGNYIRANDPNGIAVVNQLQPIAVVFSLPEDDLFRVLKAKDRGKDLAVEVYDRDLRTRIATGKLLTFDNQVDPTTATVRFKAILPNEDEALFPNQFVNARLLVETRRDAVIVPAAAIQRSPRSVFVYVVQADSTVDPRDVVLGPGEGDEVIVESGLAAGDVVVTEGLDKLQKGSRVAARIREGKGDGSKGDGSKGDGPKGERGSKGEKAPGGKGDRGRAP